MDKPPVKPRSLSTSTLDDHEAVAQHQFLSVTSASSSHLSLAIVQSQSPQNNKATTKAYPIPARRTQKFRRRSSDTLNSIEECQSLPACTKAPVPLLKRPLGQQYSNPELSQRIKPPRPPPPVRQAPPRTYTQPDVHVPKGMSEKSVSRTPVVIDSRARRQRHSELPLPKRPPLPYETVVPRSPQGSQTDGDGDVRVGSETNEIQETRNIVASPADYEVAIPASSRNTLISGTKSKFPLRGNESEPDGHMYAEISDSIQKDVLGHDVSLTEEGVGCEPLYIEMNPTVYISPPKDYKGKKRSAKVDIKR